MKRLSDRLGSARRYLADCARVAQCIGDLLHQVFPLGLGCLSESEAQREFAISQNGVLDLGLERAVFA